MVAWGMVRLLHALINWRARVSYERAHAMSVVEVVRAIPPGATVREHRTDGAELLIRVPALHGLCRCSAHEVTAGKQC
jgi:hypothetical protein